MHKDKLLFVHHSGNFGGAPKSLSFIVKDLDRSKYVPVLLNISKGPINEFFQNTLNCEIIVDNVMLRPFHGSYVVENSFSLFLRNWVYFIPTFFKAIKHLRRIKPDLVHLNSTCLFAFALAAKFLGIKVTCHVREPIRKGITGWPLRFFNKACVKGFIAISQFDLSSLGKIKKSVEATVIYNFVDEYAKKSKADGEILKNKLGLKADTIVFLYLARFAKSNGWEQLIKNASVFVKKHENAHFILLGAKDSSLKSLGDSNIHILEFQKDVKEYLKGADVFVCPFILPHFARGVIEASAYSLPIVGTNIGGVNELVVDSKTGYLYNSATEFEQACRTLYYDEGMREEMGNQAYSFARKYFDSTTNLKVTYDFFERQLNR